MGEKYISQSVSWEHTACDSRPTVSPVLPEVSLLFVLSSALATLGDSLDMATLLGTGWYLRCEGCNRKARRAVDTNQMDLQRCVSSRLQELRCRSFRPLRRRCSTRRCRYRDRWQECHLLSGAHDCWHVIHLSDSP